MCYAHFSPLYQLSQFWTLFCGGKKSAEKDAQKVPIKITDRMDVSLD